MPASIKKSEFERVYADYKRGVIDGDFTVDARYGGAAKAAQTQAQVQAQDQTEAPVREKRAVSKGRRRRAA